ncbi:hypothetical protein BJF78_34115 [Pseudonocardia sp. CNS-139]|nr:hypothetical protein BJF78_34115 [Pseudonocardia sp. CNS-139]
MQVDRTRVYKVSAVAELLDLSKSTIYRAIESGELSAMRIGATVRIPGQALASWLEHCGMAGNGLVVDQPAQTLRTPGATR